MEKEWVYHVFFFFFFFLCRVKVYLTGYLVSPFPLYFPRVIQAIYIYIYTHTHNRMVN